MNSQCCLILDKAIILDGFVTKVIGPFENMEKALSYGNKRHKDLEECGGITVETLLTPKE